MAEFRGWNDARLPMLKAWYDELIAEVNDAGLRAWHARRSDTDARDRYGRCGRGRRAAGVRPTDDPIPGGRLMSQRLSTSLTFQNLEDRVETLEADQPLTEVKVISALGYTPANVARRQFYLRHRQ